MEIVPKLIVQGQKRIKSNQQTNFTIFSGQTIFELKKISSGETTTVELLLNSENIVPKLLPVTQSDGCVKNFHSLNKFDLEKAGEILADNVCLEPMPGIEWDEESNKKFSQIYSEGKTHTLTFFQNKTMIFEF